MAVRLQQEHVLKSLSYDVGILTTDSKDWIHITFCPGYKVANANGFGGKIIEVDYATKKLIYQASISSDNSRGFHRARRFSPYP